jgi:hypothetical protein
MPIDVVITPDLVATTEALPFARRDPTATSKVYYVAGSKQVVFGNRLFYIYAPLDPPADAIVDAVWHGEHLSLVYHVEDWTRYGSHVCISAFSEPVIY